MVSQLNETLKSLCCNNGWSYGVFWRVNRRNSMLLTLEDAYFEDQIRTVIDKFLQPAHIVGEGVIGRAALTGNHRWMFSDTYYGEWSPTGSVDNLVFFQDYSEYHQQFSFGIKTIVVISVAPEGVVQFGSTQKILERLDFVDYIGSLFQQLGSVDRILPSRNEPMTSNSEIYDPSGIVAPIDSSRNYCSNYGKKPLHDGRDKDPMGKSQSAMVLPQSNPFTLGLQDGSMRPLMSNSSFQLKNQFQTSGAEAQVILSIPKMQFPSGVPQFTGNSANNSAPRNPSTSTWNSQGCNFTSFEQQMLSGMGMQESPNVFSSNIHTPVSCRNTVQNFQGNANLTSLYGTSGLINAVTSTTLHEVNKPTGNGSGKLVDVQYSAPLFHATEGEPLKGSTGIHTSLGEFRPVSSTTALTKSNPKDNQSPWIAQSLEQGNNVFAAPLNDNLSQVLGVASTSSGLVGGDVFNGVPINQAATSVQNSVTDTIISQGGVYDWKENSFSLSIQQPAGNDLFDGLGLDFGQTPGGECWDDIILPVGNGSRASLSTGTSECISELDAGSMAGPSRGFLTELGLEKLWDGIAGNDNSDTKPSSEDQLSTTTKTRTGNASVYGSQAQLAGLSCLDGIMDYLHPECEPVKTTVHRNQKDPVLKSRVGAWVDDSYSINTESAVTKQTKKPEEPVKANKKRARPGESTRPRPKDRQQIQDRVKDLREIIPSGAKCSIDALLHRSVKQILFLQSVLKYAEKLKRANESKMIGDESGVVLKDHSSGGEGGATWAYEVRGQTMICPIKVEDLSPPGHILIIEMVCENRGFFLEIADAIRGFGLTILKGVMEVQGDKIRGRFVVEANRDITRMDIFFSLVQLVQQIAASGTSSSSHPSKDVDGGVPQMNYQHSPIQLPIELGNQLH